MELLNAKGVRDFGPAEKIARQKVVDTLRETFENYGFNPIETPILERFDVLASKYAGGAEILKETFTLNDQGNRDLCLRYDLTVPFARYVGMNRNLKMPFKRYAIGQVFRDGPIKLGRYREFWQCDVDVVGSKSVMSDAELLSLAKEAFKKLKLKTVIKLNNRKVLDGILQFCKIPEKKWIDTILSIDKLEKIGEKGVKQELESKGIKETNEIFTLIKKQSNNKETIENLSKYLTSGIGKEGLDEISEILSLVDVEFDPSLARGLAYYTGPVFEAFLVDNKIKSAILGGGRYDNLIDNFLGTKDRYPAVGISFGLEVITDAMGQSEQQSVVKALIVPIKTNKESFKIATKLRAKGLNIEIDVKGRGVSKNLDFANYYNIPYVIIIGERELSENKVLLKNMKTGKETLVTQDKIIEKLL